MSTNGLTKVLEPDFRDWSEHEDFENDGRFALGEYDVSRFGPTLAVGAAAKKLGFLEEPAWSRDLIWAPSKRQLFIGAKSFRHAYRDAAKQRSSLNVELERVIEHSRSLLRDSQSDGDAISPPTWKRVKKFLLTQAEVCLKLFEVELPVPEINPAGEGSIDLFWQLEGYQLLLNFPAGAAEPITYYGQTTDGNQTIAGRTTPQNERPDLVAWLVQKKT